MKLERIKRRLKQLQLKEYSNVEGRIDSWFEQLQHAQETLASTPEDLEAQQLERLAASQYKHWLGVEFSIIHQKARVHWLQEGDSNTTYFHYMLKEKRAKSRLSALQDEHGNVITEEGALINLVVEFYKDLLGTRASVLQGIDRRILDRRPKLSGQDS